MEYRRLGKTDMNISVVSMGLWAVGDRYWGDNSDQGIYDAIKTSFEKGINSFDTAELYGEGHSEEVLGDAVKKFPREEMLLASKVWNDHHKKNDAKKACEDMLKRLKTDYMDLCYIHYFNEEEASTEETMEAMLELKQEGKIRAIGLSNFTVAQMKKAMACGRIDAYQPCYSLLWRFIESDMVPFAIENEISLITYSSLAQGLLTGTMKLGERFTEGGRARAALFQPEWYDKCVSVAEALRPFAEKYQKSIPQVAINWSIMQPGITSAIVGSQNSEQAADNASVTDWKLSAEDLREIDKIGRAVTDTMPRFKLFFRTDIEE